MKIIKGEIVVKYYGTKCYPFDWETVEDIIVVMRTGVPLTIEKGFITDFASVPKFLWSFFAPIGQINLASVIHDYLYTNHLYNRKFADQEFLAWMNFLTPDRKIRNRIMYLAVRIFGKNRYNKYKLFK